MSIRDEYIGAAVQTLRAGRSQQSVADAMRAKGHKWSQATMWSIEKGDRRLLLTEAADLAELLDVPVTDLLSPPDELEAQADLLLACRNIRSKYDNLVWDASELYATHDIIEIHLANAHDVGLAISATVLAEIEKVKPRTPENAVREAKALNEASDVLTREDFDAYRRSQNA